MGSDLGRVDGGNLLLPVVLAVASLLVVAPLQAQCIGDCNDDGVVRIGELIRGVGIALERQALEQCPTYDGDDDGSVGIAELIRAVRNALNGCPPVSTSTPTDSPRNTSTAANTATPIPTLVPQGPVILLLGLSTADDRMVEPSRIEDGVPVFEVPQGRAFHIIAEAGLGPGNVSPLLATFRDDGPPDFQIQVNRPLGNGSAAVCDGLSPIFGGVPAINPPTFDDPEAIRDALNDFGCRFQDSNMSGAQRIGRSCSDACVRFEDGTFGCSSGSAVSQFCSIIVSVAEEFPPGDTLVSARVVGVVPMEGRVAGPVRRMIVRVVPPLSG